MAKGKEEQCCRGGMGGMCKAFMGLSVLIAGLAIIAGELGMMGNGVLVGGIFLALFGACKLAHIMGLCGMCCK